MSGITDPTEAYFKGGQWGWDGTQWRKLPLVWGYSGIWDEDLGGTATAAIYTDNSAAVPAGEVWVLQALSAKNETTNPATITLFAALNSGGTLALDYKAAPGAKVPALALGNFALCAGSVVHIHMTGCVIGDDIQAGICGYKMKITE